MSFVLPRGTLAIDPARPDDPGHWIVVWVDHPDVDEREDNDYPRYSIQVWSGFPGDYGDPDTERFPVLEAEDLAEAVRHVQKRAGQLGLTPPPSPPGAARDVASALAFINKQRARSGIRPLDTADWTDDDILREAERLRSPNPLKKRLLNA